MWKRIGITEWSDYFENLLGGVEGRVRGGESREAAVEEGEGLGREEVRRTLVRAKENKVGIDKIPAKAWKYGGEGLEEWVWEMCNSI